MLDPDTGNEVTLAVYKHENGGMFAIDASFLTAGGEYLTTDADDDDSSPIVPDVFKNAADVSPDATVILCDEANPAKT